MRGTLFLDFQVLCLMSIIVLSCHIPPGGGINFRIKSFTVSIEADLPETRPIGV